MLQSRIAIKGKKLLFEKPRLSSIEENQERQTADNVWSEICELKKQIEQLTKRVTELEKANIEVDDLTADDSFPSTASVHSSDLSDYTPNGICPLQIFQLVDSFRKIYLIVLNSVCYCFVIYQPMFCLL